MARSRKPTLASQLERCLVDDHAASATHVASLRQQITTAEGTAELDQSLVAHIMEGRKALSAAAESLREMGELLGRVTSPPLYPAVFLQRAKPFDRRQILVRRGNANSVVQIADDLDVDQLILGDEVLLNHELNVAVEKSPFDASQLGGETAKVEQVMDNNRLSIRFRDEELIVSVADLKRGDSIMFDRSQMLAREKLNFADGTKYFLDEKPTCRPDQVGGQSQAMGKLLSALMTILLAPDKAEAYGISGRQSIMMTGPPGVGKTLMARVAASEIERGSGKSCHFAVVKPGEWESPFVGQTQHNIRACFRELSEAAETGYVVAFFDEVEAIGRIRSGHSSNAHGEKFLAALLAELDGFAARGNVAIVSATNRKDLIDAALLERLAEQEIQVDRPGMQEAAEIFRIHLPASIPYCPNGQLAANTHSAVVERAVSLLFAPNADTALATIRFRDGKSRTVHVKELCSGRLIEQICRAARARALLRDVERGESGVRISDIECAVGEAIARLSTTLSVANVRSYLSDLPQDMDVVGVEAVVRPKNGRRSFLNLQ